MARVLLGIGPSSFGVSSASRVSKGRSMLQMWAVGSDSDGRTMMGITRGNFSLRGARFVDERQVLIWRLGTESGMSKAR